MSVRIILYFGFVMILLSACSTQKQSASAPQRNATRQPTVVNNNPKFLENISINSESSDNSAYETDTDKRKSRKRSERNVNGPAPENASAIQAKYAVLLNTAVTEVKDIGMYQYIDDWYGTKYCMGGNTKKCTDCSGFVQNFFSQLYSVNLPRTAKEQYNFGSRISTSKLRQGDLLFFNTRGGISHVGIYLQNNKFVHASTTNGVMISDMDEAYYAKRFVGARRVDRERP
jgi:cell wall-associated NlpC family hydrolase